MYSVKKEPLSKWKVVKSKSGQNEKDQNQVWQK